MQHIIFLGMEIFIVFVRIVYIHLRNIHKLIHKLYVLKIIRNVFLDLVATIFKEIFKGFEKKYKTFL